MKKSSILALLILCLLSAACNKNTSSQLRNFPIPVQPDTLRILGWGNSFTDDGMQYLPDLLEAAGIRNVVLGRLYIGGCTLERHCREYRDALSNYIYYKSRGNHWVTVSPQSSATEALKDEPWDIIVLQQASGLSGIYETYHPWVEELFAIARKYCPNKKATIAWQQTWAYARTSTHPEFPNYKCSQDTMFRAIAECCRRLVEDTPIRVVIPSGPALQELRKTAFCDSLDFTRDGYHLSYGMGRYLAACCWFETLVAPAFGVTVRDNSFRLQGTPEELSELQALVCREYACMALHSAQSVSPDKGD
ncbi:MAG: DUF4886 domain-containing protein [Bacteroidaceae bacterium]|nr:DUF4886 domain-containing protein [Bacteroidaceae bacterium]